MPDSRPRRFFLIASLTLTTVALAGCDMSLLAFAPPGNTAQKQRITSNAPLHSTNRRLVAPPREYRLGSGDRLGEASFAIYRNETLVATTAP